MARRAATVVVVLKKSYPLRVRRLRGDLRWIAKHAAANGVSLETVLREVMQ